METLSGFLAFVWIIVFLAFIALLIRPTLLKNFYKGILNRKQIGIYGSVILILIAIGVSLTTPVTEKQEQNQDIVEQTQPTEQTTIAESERVQEIKVEEVPKQDPNTYWHQVTEVVDGDTIRANVDGVNESIRIIGLDAPETYTSNECYGNESTARAKELLTGTWVQLERDSSQDNRDRYDRLLRFVWMEDGKDFGLQMLSEGFAYEYTYNVAYKYQKDYQNAENSAKSNKKGLWSPDTCNGQLQAPEPEPVYTPAPTPTPSQAPTSNCDPNYTPCVPNVSYDLDCGDIGFSVRVIGTDKHRFDRDGDGYGCESY